MLKQMLKNDNPGLSVTTLSPHHDSTSLKEGDSLLHKTSLSSLNDIVDIELEIIGQDSPGRDAVEQFAYREYARTYSADLRSFSNKLMVLRSTNGKIIGCVGINSDDRNSFFLENYFESPIEYIISDQKGSPVKRESIVEIGTLATASSGVCRLLMAGLIGHLLSCEKRFLTFTAVKILKNTLRHLGIPANRIIEAKKDCLPHSDTDWGRYYDASPEVLWIDVRRCLASVNKILKSLHKLESNGTTNSSLSVFFKKHPPAEKGALRYPDTMLGVMFIKGLSLPVDDINQS